MNTPLPTTHLPHAATTGMPCPVCNSPMRQIHPPWCWECPTCQFLTSDLWDATRWETKTSTLDEHHRSAALESLRQKNAQRVLDTLATLLPLSTSTLCDIGSGHGWFLDAATARGLDTIGIEPDPQVATTGSNIHHTILCGMFPEVLPKDRQFDIITFNDVLEHLPDTRTSIRATYGHLKPGGLLSVVIPSSRGAVYQTAKTLVSLGITHPFDRCWQKGFHSPHLAYFNETNLVQLIESEGFTSVHQSFLPTVERQGAFSRSRMDTTQSLPKTWILGAGLTVFALLERWLPPDTLFHVYRKG